MHPTLHSRARNVFGAQLYKNNTRALLSHIFSIVNSDWLQHASSVRGGYEYFVTIHHTLDMRGTSLDNAAKYGYLRNMLTMSHNNLRCAIDDCLHM